MLNMLFHSAYRPIHKKVDIIPLFAGQIKRILRQACSIIALSGLGVTRQNLQGLIFKLPYEPLIDIYPQTYFCLKTNTHPYRINNSSPHRPANLMIYLHNKTGHQAYLSCPVETGQALHYTVVIHRKAESPPPMVRQINEDGTYHSLELHTQDSITYASVVPLAHATQAQLIEITNTA